MPPDSTFDPAFRLEDLSRQALARLGREYMLFGHIRDRALMPLIAMRYGPPATEEMSILEWMGASPHYTRRMQRAMRVVGDGVPTIMKSLQLDVGFPHRYMDVGYEVESEAVGTFWLGCCNALLDVEPYGEKAVLSVCHAIEDPTFDATAFATNPRARVRPVHRPPRVPADRVPHCRWEIRIDAENEPVPEPAITRSVGSCRLPAFELDPPAVEDQGGLADYGGAFVPDLRLELFSRPALVTICKEFLLQNQLLGRSSMLAVGEKYGEEAAHEILTAQWKGLAPLSTRRIREALGIGGDDVASILRTLQVHPVFPRDYLRLGFALEDDSRGRFWVEDCAALEDAEPKGLLTLLDDPACPGLDAMVQAVNPRARCRTLEPGRVFEVVVDADADPAQPPAEARFVELSTVARFRFPDVDESQA